MTFHDITLPIPASQVRVDGWSPQRQRLFVETLAATGIVRAALTPHPLPHILHP